MPPLQKNDAFGRQADRRERSKDRQARSLARREERRPVRSYKDIIKAKCGGQLRVPTFINTETNEVFCGEVEYERLVKWAS